MKKKRSHAEMNEDELDDLANDMRLIMKKKRSHAAMNEDELDDLANDMRLIKKLRKGKVWNL